MAGSLMSFSSMVCDKLDANAGASWDNAELKQFHLRFKELHFLLQKVSRSSKFDSDQNVIRNSLEGLISEVDDLVDAWVQSEISRLKFDHKLRRVGGRLAPLLNSLREVAASGHREEDKAAAVGDDEEHIISTLEGSSSRSEQAVLERDIESSVSTVTDVLLCNANMVLVLTLVGVSGTGNTALAHGIFTDKRVKSQFPFRFWFSVGENIDLSRILNAIAVHCSAEKVCERLLIVLDDVCDLNDEKLDNFILLVSNHHQLRPVVLVTTRSDCVETMIRIVPAQHFTYFRERNTWSDFNNELPPSLKAHSCRLGHDKDVRLEEPTSLKRHSTSSVKDEMSGQFEELSKKVTTAYPEAESAMDEDAAPVLENMTKEQTACPPQTDILAIQESEIQLASIETRRMAAHMVGTIATTSDVSMPDMEFEDDFVQNKQKIRQIL